MSSTDEYQQQQYWKENWFEKETKRVLSDIQKQNEEWFSRTHDQIMERINKIKNEK